MSSDDVKTLSAWSIFKRFLFLGCTAFGGPIAHLAYFRQTFVNDLKWFDDKRYADLVALCQVLPGPASSQVGIGIGHHMGGYKGALSAWAGFTFPSVLILCLFAASIQYGGIVSSGMIDGLKAVAVVVVAQAFWAMKNSLCKTDQDIIVMLIACIIASLISGFTGQLIAIGLGLLYGLTRNNGELESNSKLSPISHKSSKLFLLTFMFLLFTLPAMDKLFDSGSISLFDSIYRSGALVFGGGHVVLPLLESELVPSHLSNDLFIAGYGATQAVPGPLFTFSSYIGFLNESGASGLLGALLATAAIFLPSFLILFAALPHWEVIRTHSKAQKILGGVNVAVVGLLLAALFNPVAIGGLSTPSHFSLAILAFLSLKYGKLPIWLVVIFGGILGHFIL